MASNEVNVTMTTITLNNGDVRPVQLDTGTLYRFEKRGGRLINAKEQPVSTMVDLLLCAIRRSDETDDQLLAQLPSFGTVAAVMQKAMEEAGLGELKAQQVHGRD